MPIKRVLVGCEESGKVREAIRLRGHDAISCDLMRPRDGSPHHIRGDLLSAIRNDGPWDVLIAFPPCKHLSVSGARWFKEKKTDGRQEAQLRFVCDLMETDVERIAIENPVSIISSHIRPPDQVIQPFMFGHAELKATCLWLKNLPRLKPTRLVPPPYEQRVWLMGPSPTRAALRSETYQGIADAMADQWVAALGDYAIQPEFALEW